MQVQVAGQVNMTPCRGEANQSFVAVPSSWLETHWVWRMEAKTRKNILAFQSLDLPPNKCIPVWSVCNDEDLWP